MHQKIRLSVLAQRAEDPQCTHTVLGNFNNLICEATGGDPPANVSWYEGNSQISTDIVTSELSVPSSSEHRVFTCQAQQASIPPKICTIMLNSLPTSRAPSSTVAYTNYPDQSTLPTEANKNCDCKSQTTHNAPVVIGASVCAILLLILIILHAIVLYRWRVKSKPPGDDYVVQLGNGSLPPHRQPTAEYESTISSQNQNQRSDSGYMPYIPDKSQEPYAELNI